MLERSEYDVVLCDVQMPNLGGLALYEHLRRQQPDAIDRFVFISGDILNDQLHSFTESSNVPLLSKPFGAEKLDRVLEEVTARRYRPRPQGAI